MAVTCVRPSTTPGVRGSVAVVRDNSTEGSGAPSQAAEGLLAGTCRQQPDPTTDPRGASPCWMCGHGGRRPATVKAAVGELVMVNCVAFREGHDRLGWT